MLITCPQLLGQTEVDLDSEKPLALNLFKTLYGGQAKQSLMENSTQTTARNFEKHVFIISPKVPVRTV